MTKRILVVEDQPDNRQIIRDMLAPTDYEITEAEDGQQALEAIATQRPDLILMDIQLPIIDGYIATRKIKADPALRSIPIIAVTSYALSGEEKKAQRQAVMTMCRSLTARANCWRKSGSTCPNRLKSIAASQQLRVISAIRSLRPALTRCGNMQRSA
jgi:two-component system cell cycle response regulator DivK